MATQHPLAAFSFYLAGRHQVLLTVAAEIVGHLDTIDAATSGPRTRASDLMWLWTLGAYEVVRTMCQSEACFTPGFYRSIAALKLDLERVRVPNTKMERLRYNRKDRPVPVPSARAADTYDERGKDLLVGDPADAVSARSLLREYTRVLASLTLADVVLSHEDSLTSR
jgi:hypothetical protein